MAKSNSVEMMKGDRNTKFMIGHAPDRESFGDSARKAAMPKEMPNVGISHSITGDGKVKKI